MITAVTTVAPAKINLVLDVGGRRPDGFHELDSLFVAIDLVDEVLVEPAREDALVVTGPAADGVPTDGSNLVVRAIEALRVRFDIPPLRVILHKRIPPAGGLGGGSSDAAAVIRAADRLLGLGLDRPAQAAVGIEVGSDVPFFSHGGAARVRGRGELVEELVDGTTRLIVMPLGSASAGKTGRLFAALDRAERAPLFRTAALAATWPAVEETHLGNDFERVCAAELPESARAWDIFLRAGIQPHLSGAGPSLFALPLGGSQIPGAVSVRTLSRADSLALRGG